MLFGDEMPQRSSEWPLKESAMTVAGPALRLITPLHQEPGQTGVDRGQSLDWKSGWAKLVAGLWPCWSGDKKTGEAPATGPARPGLAAVGRGQNWQGKAKNINGLHGLDRPWLVGVKTGKAKVWPTIGLHWLRLAGPKIGQACQETLTSLAKIIITGHAYLFRVYLEWSVLQNIVHPSCLKPQRLALLLIWLL